MFCEAALTHDYKFNKAFPVNSLISQWCHHDLHDTRDEVTMWGNSELKV